MIHGEDLAGRSVVKIIPMISNTMSINLKDFGNITSFTYLTGNETRYGYIYAIHDDYVELMPTWGYAASAFALFVIGFLGFFLNLMVIILMCKDKQLWTPLNVILFNLVCSDFSVSILGNPFTLISALSHRWVFGKTMCVVYGFFMTLLGITSITTLTVLSFERYMMVSRPLSVRHLSMRGASFSIFFIWCYSFAVSSPPLFGWGNFVHEAANISCSVNWEEQTLNALTYILFLFATGLIIPVAVITFSYMNIIKTMKKNAMRVGRVSKAEKKVTTMVLIMIVTFLVVWTPYSIFALIEQFAPYDMVSPGLATVPALVAKSSICYDPIIYVGMNTQFRASVRKIFKLNNKEESVNERGLENTLMSPTKAVSQSNDNNIKLQYLNPRSNALVSVTIYHEEDDEDEAGKNSDGKSFKYRKENTKKMIILSGNEGNEDSSDLSTLSVEREQRKKCLSTHIQKLPNEFRKDVRNNKKVVTYNLEGIPSCEHHCNNSENNEKAQDKYGDFDNDLKNLSENSSSDLINEGYKSDDLLISSPCYRKNKSDYGVENRGLVRTEEGSFGSRKKFNSRRASNLSYTTDNMPMRYRRKSLNTTTFTNEFNEPLRTRNTNGRRSSISVFSGSTRKFTSTFQGSRGLIVSRLMVDERDRSKMMKNEEMKSPYLGPQTSNEFML